ncbi:MAG: bifunctional folylpolyglutamate synthase/dihydrofolate synthase [Acidobacteria bacterium]|nr:MAG: bifunctional folylpolyglutamate synthase/dihydrofolate synthase [Acidobacteriota bacterium]
MTYREALAYLDSLEAHGIRPGLDRIDALLARLGSPQTAFPSVLIAGTNGKGSVAAFLGSILRQGGHAPGVYTSPHLVRFEERIVVGDEMISESDLATLAGEVRSAIEAGTRLHEDPPTYFEATSALAFLHFSRRRVPMAVLEVGMGGRFDATNVVRPLVCAITPISLDHTQWLGKTLGEIAYQKAGILEAGVPAIIAKQAPAALEVIQAEASQLGTPLTLTTDCKVGRGRPGCLADPPVFSLVTPSGRRYPELALSLRGAHQVDNAVVAVLLAEQLADRGVPGIDSRAIAAGFRTAVWPGRLELVPGRPELLLDGAHNPAGCETLAAYLREQQPGRHIILVFAVMKDKPADQMLDLLCPLVRKVIVTRVPVPRGEAPENLLRLAAARHHAVAHAESVANALALARDAAGREGLVVVSGSLYLVGEIKKGLSAAPALA